MEASLKGEEENRLRLPMKSFYNVKAYADFFLLAFSLYLNFDKRGKKDEGGEGTVYFF